MLVLVQRGIAVNKRLMVVGAGVFQVPAIRKAKDMGLTVVATDMKTEAPGLKLADIPVAVSTTDISGSIQVAREHKIDGVMTMASDVPVETVAAIAEALGLPGIPLDVAKRARNKLLTHRRFAADGIPTAPFQEVRTVEEAEKAAVEIGLPVMIKPVDNSGSRGVSKVDCLEGVRRAVEFAASNSKVDTLCVEKFIEGTEFGAETFTIGNDTKLIAITRKSMTAPPHFVPLGHTIPADLPPRLEQLTCEVITMGIHSLGIDTGPANVDVRLTSEGPVILEIGARLGGTCLPEVVFQSSGIDTVRAAINTALGNQPDLGRCFDRAAAARLIVPKHGGRVTRIRVPSAAELPEEVVEIAVDVEVGAVVQPFSCGADRIGHVIAVGETPQKAGRSAEKARDMVQIEVEPER